MLEFFHDSALTVINSQAKPKIFLGPLAGINNKLSVIYMADTYQAIITANAASGANTLYLSKTDEFLTAGTARLTNNGTNYTVTYTGKTLNSLTGVSGVTAAISVGATIKPWKVYKCNGNFTFIPRGADLNTLNVSIGLSPNSYSYPGTIAISTANSYDNVTDSPIPLYISISCPSGAEQEFSNWSITSNPIYVKDYNDSSPLTASDIGYTLTCYGYFFRRDQFQLTSLRLLPNSQIVTSANPGFVIGKYRWRDETTVNSTVVIPTKWDPDVNAIGVDKFVSGIGDRDDLEPIKLESQDNSIFCLIKNGFYWVGPQRFFLPANTQMTFVPGTVLNQSLNPNPNIGTPVFVGVWQLDSNGFYTIKIDYRYQASGVFNTLDSAPTYQYTLNKATNQLQLNVAQTPQIYYLGSLSGLTTDHFNIPTYPVDSISSVYVDRGVGNTNLYSSNYSFDRDFGTLTITSPNTGDATSIPGALENEPVYAVCNPAYAIVYDSGQTNQRLLTEVDLNPAYAGISSGYLYLQHHRQSVESLVLSADKPIIDIPATYSSIIDLIAYGPVYFGGDYCLLTVEAFGNLDNEVVPNAEVVIIPGANFSGTINYQDPTTVSVTAITGSDGKANFVYIPDKNFGYYIPLTAGNATTGGIGTTNITDDSIFLPTPIAIDEIYNTKEGWLTTLYNVINNNPLFGMTGGNPALGQIPFATTGTAGTTNYKANGELVAWANGQVNYTPIDAKDSAGYSYTNPSFNGQVVRLVFGQALSTSNVGAYFITFVQRVTIQVQFVGSNVISNIILLEMAVPNTINQNPWLVLNDATQGLLNQYRLGWTHDISNTL